MRKMRQHHPHLLRRILGILALGLTLALTAACGGDGGDEEDSPSAGHNDADVAFATEMIPHHAQALSMVDLTLERPLDPAVAQLAEAIREAQTPEIEAMTNWLEQWGEEVPATMRDHAHAGHGDAPGMMSDDDMAALADASDADFQRLWLEMMIEHHRGAIEMAETEQSDGDYGPAVDLAGEIIEAQTAEIERMEQLLEE